MSEQTNYLPFTPNAEQVVCLQGLDRFVQGTGKLAILKGHAGTGKTSLIMGVIAKLLDQGKPCYLLASTGRAAKVLSEKTKYSASTIHRHIYRLVSNLIEIAKTENEFKLIFELAPINTNPNAVFFVDESSMIADSKTMNMNLRFGDGRLLNDFLSFVGPGKVVFIGDPAQLPPVNYIVSPALNPEYFQKHYNINAEVFSLTQIMRFSYNTGISSITNSLQKNIASKTFPYISLHVSRHSDIQVLASPEMLADEYVKIVKQYGTYSVIALSYTNKMAAFLNYRIRSGLFPRRQHYLNFGEMLMVVQNNYHYGLANGDHVEVLEVSENIEKRGNLSFRDIKVQGTNENGAFVLNCKIIDSFLHSDEISVSYEIEKFLLQDFIIRTSKAGITKGSERFYQLMQSDNYLNALRVKFGYAITCHKAQGGEWKNVMVALEPVLFVQNPEVTYRWMYTAISRATEKLYLTRNRCLY